MSYLENLLNSLNLEDHIQTAKSEDDCMKAINQVEEALVHHSLCTNECHHYLCEKFKKITKHLIECKKNNKQCSICKQYIAINCYHAKRCSSINCSVPLCNVIKKHITPRK